MNLRFALANPLAILGMKINLATKGNRFTAKPRKGHSLFLSVSCPLNLIPCFIFRPINQLTCADPESFVRGRPTLVTFFLSFFFSFFFWGGGGYEGREAPNSNIGPSSVKRHFNIHVVWILMAFRWRADDGPFILECWLGSFVILGGGGGGYEGREAPNSNIGPSSVKRHFNIHVVWILMAFRWRADDGPFILECWLGSFVIFLGIRTSIAKKPNSFVMFQWGGTDPLSPLWTRTWLLLRRYTSHSIHSVF